MLNLNNLASFSSIGRNINRTVDPFRERNSKYQAVFNGTNSVGVIADAADIRPETGNKFSMAFWLDPDLYDNNVLPRIWEKALHFVSIMGDDGNGKYSRLALAVAASVDNGNGTGRSSESWGSTVLALT